jgi:transposase
MHVSDIELLHKSKDEPVRRLEVFTGCGRRRSWTAAQKARIVAESYASGDDVSSVARRHGLTPQQLFGWRRDAQRCVAERSGDSAGGMTFASVLVEAGTRAKVGPTPSCATTAGMIEIALGVATVRVGPGADVATLTKVLRAVKAAT